MTATAPKADTVADLAARYRVSERTVRRWIAQRRIPFHRIAGVVRFTPADLEAIEAATLIAPEAS